MGRKSKLTDKQWDEIRKRYLAGEKGRVLAREYDVSETAIRKKIGLQCVQIKTIADHVFEAETALKKLPISSQIATLTLVNEMRSISDHLSSAAQYGASTAHRLSAIANAQVVKVDGADPMNSQEVLQGISALTKITNDSAKLGIDLINASKKDPLPDKPETKKLTGFRMVEE